MKILLVNNHSKHITELLQEIKSVQLIDFEKISDKSCDEFDGIILSGGSAMSVVNHQKEYSKEIELIKNCKKPILGICLGFELINFAFEERIQFLEAREKGFLTIEVISKDKIFDRLPRTFKVYESHRWAIIETKTLIPLAKSKKGIEAVKHPTKKIYGTQFHPEVTFEKNITKIILENFLKIINESKEK